MAFVTDPSPDCGYTDASDVREQTIREGILALVGAAEPVLRGDAAQTAARMNIALDALAAALAEQTRRTDQAWEEIARLREFGEHYSGAAQEAWDRIVVLEKALREARRWLYAWQTNFPAHISQGEPVITREEYERLSSAVLRAGSASPGGAET